jgi:hypothetical protein
MNATAGASAIQACALSAKRMTAFRAAMHNIQIG